MPCLQALLEIVKVITVVAMHGWGADAELILPFAKILHQSGYAGLLVDARNHGRSDSDSFSSMPRFAEGLEHGFSWIHKQPELDPQRIALLCHSESGGAALQVGSYRGYGAAVVIVLRLPTLKRMGCRSHISSAQTPAERAFDITRRGS